MKRVIYFDVETTGVRPDKDKIIEIAAYCPQRNASFVELVNPGCCIPEEAIQIHQITDEMVKDAAIFEKVGKTFAAFCGENAVLVAHNNDSFDKLFLHHEFKRHGLNLPSWTYLDSLKWARKYRPDLPKHTLQHLREQYGIAANQAHRALDDVMVLYQVFSLMIDDLTIDTVIELLSQTTQMMRMPFGKHQGKSLKQLPKTYINWLKEKGVLDKQENAPLRESLESLGLLKAIPSA